MHQGVIAGCDRHQEWLLPLWWEHYAAHNAYPVAFIDFGMTEEGKNWCRQRGRLIPLPNPPFSLRKKCIPPDTRTAWENHYGKKIWSRRRIWFKKPFALLLSPFPFSLWVDLDCQVHRDLEPLFNCLALGIDIALKRESNFIQEIHHQKGFISKEEVNYDCGLIAFRNDAPILRQWTQEIIARNEQYVFDQQALSKAILLHNPPLLEFPSLYNWSAAQAFHPDAFAIHYHGGALKQILMHSQRT